MKMRFFKEAKKESLLSDYNGQHLGAVAVYGDKVILAKAHNSNKTNTTQYFYNRYRVEQKSNIMSKPPRSHAEVNLLRRIRFLDIDFSRVSVYIYRELKNGELGMARCCPACMEALKSLGIKKICYTTDVGYAEEKIK